MGRKGKALFSCAENLSVGSSALGDEVLGGSCEIGRAGSSPSHPTVPPCRNLPSICLWLQSEQSEEKPPSLRTGREEPGRLFWYFEWEWRRGEYQTGFFNLPTFPIGKTKKQKTKTSLSPLMQEWCSKAAVVGFHTGLGRVHSPGIHVPLGSL